MAAARKAFGYRWVTAAICIAFLMAAGCGVRKSVTFVHVTNSQLQELKTYQWGKAKGLYRQDPILEAHVQHLTDQFLAKKGLIQKPGAGDLLVWMSYEFEYSDLSDKIKSLSLNISRGVGGDLLWQGTAQGNLRSDTAAGDLKKALEGIFTGFPAK